MKMKLTDEEAIALIKLQGLGYEQEQEPWKYSEAKWWVYKAESENARISVYRDYLGGGRTIVSAYKKALRELERRDERTKTN